MRRNLICKRMLVHKHANNERCSNLSVCEEYMDGNLKGATCALGHSYFMHELKPTARKVVTCVMCIGAM